MTMFQHTMKQTLTLFLLWLACCATTCRASGLPLGGSQATVFRKTCPLLSALEDDPALKAFCQAEPLLGQLAQDKRKRLDEASSASAVIEAMTLSDDDAQRIAKGLTSLYSRHRHALDSLMDQAIDPSGAYADIAERGAARLVAMARRDLDGLNHTVEVYVKGCPPMYPRIDSISFDVSQADYATTVVPAYRENVLALADEENLFFSIPLYAALAALDTNDRLQAADFEPLALGVNRKAMEAMATTDWTRYPYSVVLVLGEGPEQRDEPLSKGGRLRCAYAAHLFRLGEAPFVVVSGGRCHPWHTPYCEAEQMKRYLVDVQGLPEQAVIMEPHARHTTTNIRNTVRLLYRTGAPTQKPFLVTSSKQHIDYVDNKAFAGRCKREMGCVPYQSPRRVDSRSIEMVPHPSAMLVNGKEPMDP